MNARPIELVTPPLSEPLTAAELRAHLRINTTAEDDLLSEYISTAREFFELETHRHVLPTTVREWFPYWPMRYIPRYEFYRHQILNNHHSHRLPLARGEVSAITAVKYWPAGGGSLTTLSGARLVAPGFPAEVDFPGVTFPLLDCDRPLPVAIEYTCGWATLDDVPAMVISAIRLLAAHFYRFREAHVELNLQDTPHGFQRAVNHYMTGLGNWG